MCTNQQVTPNSYPEPLFPEFDSAPSLPIIGLPAIDADQPESYPEPEIEQVREDDLIDIYSISGCVCGDHNITRLSYLHLLR
jgi:hypothetical protein